MLEDKRDKRFVVTGVRTPWDATGLYDPRPLCPFRGNETPPVMYGAMYIRTTAERNFDKQGDSDEWLERCRYRCGSSGGG